MTSTADLIRTVRLMANVGGQLTPDRILALHEVADRLEELDERVAIMSETDPLDVDLSQEDWR